MKEHSIIFSGPMVRAILEGRKTQTRRVIKPQPWQETATGPSGWYPAMGHPKAKHYGSENHLRKGLAIDFCLYGQPGDLLWVRETWYDAGGRGVAPCCLGYVADGDHPHGQTYRIRASIHMPRWASRVTLRLTDVRVQRVQEISDGDIEAEGVPGMVAGKYQCTFCNGNGWNYTYPQGCPHCNGSGLNPRHHFLLAWDSLNAKRGYGWDTNPWVWAISFQVTAHQAGDATCG